MTLKEITNRIETLDAEYDRLTETIQERRHHMQDVAGSDVAEAMSRVCRTEFDRQTAIEKEIAQLKELAKPLLA